VSAFAARSGTRRTAAEFHVSEHQRLSCREFVEFLDDFFDDALPAARQRVFVHHVERCTSCRHYLESYRLTIVLSRRACCDEADAVPTDLPESLVSAILDAHVALH
jgi:hypothetical protein